MQKRALLQENDTQAIKGLGKARNGSATSRIHTFHTHGKERAVLAELPRVRKRCADRDGVLRGGRADDDGAGAGLAGLGPQIPRGDDAEPVLPIP